MMCLLFVSLGFVVVVLVLGFMGCCRVSFDFVFVVMLSLSVDGVWFV